MDFLATLTKRGISPVDAPAVVVNGSGHGAPLGPMYRPECYCGRRLAGLETGPIPNRGPEVSAGLWVLISISGLFLALRVYLKMYRLKGLWWDDYILTCAWVTLTLSGILDQVSISLFGLGHYPCDIRSPAINIPRLTLVGDHFGAMFSMFAVAISKSSWAVTLLRLFQRGGSTTTTSSSTGWPDQRQFNICIVWFVIITTCLVKGAQGILVWIPKCGSPAALGNPDMCVMIGPLNGFATFAASMSGTYDILLAVVPWKTIWGTRLGKREKTAVAVTMSVGAVAGATAFVSAVKMRGITSENYTYDSGVIIVWSTAETATTIMASCIPVYRGFCKKLRNKLLAQYRSHGSKQRSATSRAKNGSGGSTMLTGRSTTLTSGSFRSVFDKLSQHRRKGSDGVDEPGCLSLPSGGRGCHGPTDDSASDRAILPVHDLENRGRSASEVATSRNSGKILMTQEVKIEYHHHDDILDGTDEREQTQHGHEMEDMGESKKGVRM